MDTIEIRSHFSNWRKVNKQKAVSYGQFLFRAFTIGSDESKLDLINTRYIRGIKLSLMEVRG